MTSTQLLLMYIEIYTCREESFILYSHIFCYFRLELALLIVFYDILNQIKE